jgi:hypothetical protein
VKAPTPEQLVDPLWLVGKSCIVVGRTGRCRWQVWILQVYRDYVKVSANHPDADQHCKRAFGQPRWVKISELMWR